MVINHEDIIHIAFWDVRRPPAMLHRCSALLFLLLSIPVTMWLDICWARGIFV